MQRTQRARAAGSGWMFGVVSGHDPIGARRGPEETHTEKAGSDASPRARTAARWGGEVCLSCMREGRAWQGSQAHAGRHASATGGEGAGGDSNDCAQSLETPPARENARHRQRSMGCLAGETARRGSRSIQAARRRLAMRVPDGLGVPGTPNMGARCPTREGRLTRVWGSHPTPFQPPLVLAEGPVHSVCRHREVTVISLEDSMGQANALEHARVTSCTRVVGRSDAPGANALARSS